MLSDRFADGTVTVWAPAKVNLFLEVLARRPDGYHEISTLMAAVNLFDTLEFKEEFPGGVTLSCDHPGLPTADREGELISAGLGGKHALLLAHHGLLAAGRSVQEATFLAVFMERRARQQIDAAKIGGSKPIDAVQARRARDFLRTDRIMGLTFDAWSRRAERRRPAAAATLRERG